MRFAVKTGAATKQRTACAILPVYSDGELPASTRAYDRACGGIISELFKAGDLRGETGETLLVVAGSGAPVRRLLLAGCGKRADFSRRSYRKATRAALATLARSGQPSAISYLTLEPVADADPYRRARLLAETWHEVSYRFTALKSKQPEHVPAVSSLAAAADGRSRRSMISGLGHGEAIGRGVNFARELGNLPANVCTPSYLADRARELGRRHRRLTVKVMSEAQMRKLKMGALLSVTAGTTEPARFIIMEYSNAPRSKRPVVLVGKGITFDTGGISLKPPPQMDEMKYDMCGAASVFGAVQAAAELELPINLVGIVPACENLPSGTATRPGDIVTSMSGQTVEILNTDAEGRLILCDALTYAQRYKPAALIDIATLTGACVIALGRPRSGLLANSDALAEALLKAGEDADDRAWRLPLDPEYGEQLKSNFADMANVGGREAGTITAASFLSRFAGKSDWAHLDIAGTAWLQGARKGGTGRPVPLLVEYLLAS
ncbi:MAG: leucyl aminopeptidase [Chromatiales bacterium]|nr:leucyl aminopeptidase [Chromatiales bacterium]